MTQPLASGVTACHRLKIAWDQDAGRSVSPLSSLGSLPLSTGDTIHVAERSQIKADMGGRHGGGVLSGLGDQLQV